VAAKAATLIDPLTGASINATLWGGIFGTLSESSGGLLITNPISYTGYGGMDSVSSYDLTASQFSSRLVNGGNQALTSWEVVPVRAYLNANNLLAWYLNGGTLRSQAKVGGTNSFPNSLTYSAAVHKYFRIREAGGTIFWDWSTNGVTWTNLSTLATPFAITALQGGLNAGTYNAEATATSATLDSFGGPIPSLAGTATALGVATATVRASSRIAPTAQARAVATATVTAPTVGPQPLTAIAQALGQGQTTVKTTAAMSSSARAVASASMAISSAVVLRPLFFPPLGLVLDANPLDVRVIAARLQVTGTVVSPGSGSGSIAAAGLIAMVLNTHSFPFPNPLEIFTIDPGADDPSATVTQITTGTPTHTDTTANTGWGPLAISPDHTQIAAWKVSDTTAGNGDPGLFVMNLDGSGMRKVTNVDANIAPNSGAIAWSADGTQLAMIFTDYPNSSGQAGIDVIKADNSGHHRVVLGLSSIPVTTIDWTTGNGGLVWLPDGRFAYVAANVSTGFDEIRLCSATGTGIVNVTTASLPDTDPGAISWALHDCFADGLHLLADTNNYNTDEIFLYEIALNGTVAATIHHDATGSTYFGQKAALSPDESQIATSFAGTTNALVLIDVAGSAVTVLYHWDSANHVDW
jgi:hypothetical protein